MDCDNQIEQGNGGVPWHLNPLFQSCLQKKGMASLLSLRFTCNSCLFTQMATLLVSYFLHFTDKYINSWSKRRVNLAKMWLCFLFLFFSFFSLRNLKATQHSQISNYIVDIPQRGVEFLSTMSTIILLTRSAVGRGEK